MWEGLPNLRHLRAFVEVAQHKSISHAAEDVHLSQPAITQAIAKLEEQLGVSLFDRRPDGMHPTAPGEAFLSRAAAALDHLAEGAKEMLKEGARKKTRGFANFDRLLTVPQLRALTAIAKMGNFSLAAREAGISQPSIHRTARDLEKLAGVPLFLRTSKGIELSEPASVFVRYARLAFADLRQGFSEIGEWLGLDSGTIVVGSLPLCRTHVLPVALNALTRERLQLDVRIVTGPYDDLLHGLRNGEIDMLVGALREPAPIHDIEQVAHFHDPQAILARAGHPLAKKRAVTRDDLCRFPWVLPPVGAPARTYFDRVFDGVCGQGGGVIETNSAMLVRGLLLESDRLTIMSAHQMRMEIGLGLVAQLPVEMPGSMRPIGVTARRGWRPTATQKALIDRLKAAGELETQGEEVSRAEAGEAVLPLAW